MSDQNKADEKAVTESPTPQQWNRMTERLVTLSKNIPKTSKETGKKRETSDGRQ